MSNDSSEDKGALPSITRGRSLGTLGSRRDLEFVVVFDPRFCLGAQVVPPNVEDDVVDVFPKALAIGFIGPISQQLL